MDPAGGDGCVKGINEYFDNVYVLNLDREPERYERTRRKLNALNIDFERFPAIDGESIQDDEYDFSGFVQGKGLIENKYALACLRSHIEVIKDAKSNNYNKILILEDDVLISNSIREHLNKLDDIDGWKLLYLGSSQYRWNVKFIDGFYYPKATLGCFAYALDQSLYEEILRSNREMLSIDNLVKSLQEKYYKQCFVFYPNVCIADVSASSIRGVRDQTSHGKSMRWDMLNDYV